MGGANDNLHNISQVENLQHLQERLIVSAMKRRYELAEANPNMSDEELDSAVDQYIHHMMKSNNIDEERSTE